MNEDTRDDAHPYLSAPALAEWSRSVENAMRGISHSLNNRAAALSAVIELARDPTPDDAAATSSILSSELQHVTDLSRAARTIGSARSGSEAFAPKDAAVDSLRVLHLQAEQRAGVTIDADTAPPIRAPRWMFVRALIALATAARNGGGDAVSIAIEGDGDWVVTRVAGTDVSTGEASPYTAELAKAMGGEPLADRLGFRLPALAALRQREGR